MQLSDLVVTLHIRWTHGEVALCDFLCCLCHCLKRLGKGLCNLVEQSTEQEEGDEESCEHCPFEIVHIGEDFVLRDEDDQ